MKIKQAMTFVSNNTLSALVLASVVGSAVLPNTAIAAGQKNQRWFDIEVILVSQLNDKAAIKEVFANNVSLPSFKKPVDLLTPYLQPNIAHLKQKLSFCNSSNRHISYHETAPVQSIITLKALNVLAEETEQALALSANNVENPNEQLLATAEPTVTVDIATVDVTATENTAPLNLSRSDELNQLNEPNQLNTVNDLNDLNVLTEQEASLVSQAEQHFSPVDVNYSTTMTKSQLLCQLTSNEYQQLAVDPKQFSYLGFSIDSVPRSISANENLFDPKPYLLNSESLALHDIVKELKRSREFRPLLHLGWRQPVADKRRAIPITLFAGDNLQHHYLEQLSIYQQQKIQATAQEQQLANALAGNVLAGNASTNNQLKNSENTHALTDAEQQLANQQQLLQQIISQLPTITNDTNALINALEQPVSPANIIDNNDLLLNAPAAPLQPWYLQGFMQIYINSNNRLNIIADFSMLNLTLAEQETAKLQPNTNTELQTISFKQHKQVISTETHYFDHPYLGMIVQIRRHKRPEPPVEESENTHQ